MYTILLVDNSDYRDSIAKILDTGEYSVEICESAYDAMKKLKAYDFDLVISEVELPGDNAFDLYNYINKNYPYIPTIMTTDKNMNTFFDQVFREGIGNILCKPIKSDELLTLMGKLITKKNIFGLTNYMKDISKIKKIRINNSRKIQKSISIIMKEVESWGFKIENKISFNLVLNEMVINAVYHSHGLTREKLERKSVELKDGEYVDIFFAMDSENYGIAIDDYNGNLTKMRILECINELIVQDNLIEKAAETGENISGMVSETGRGIDFLRKLTGGYYFIIKKNVRTEIIIIFRKNYSEDDLDNYSSLKIIEDMR